MWPITSMLSDRSFVCDSECVEEGNCVQMTEVQPTSTESSGGVHEPSLR